MLLDAPPPLPASLMTPLAVFSPLFTAPPFRTFTMLACGFLAQSGKRTVCGMLTGTGLSRLRPHDRAHYFFSRARWDLDDLGLCAAKLVIALLVPDGEPAEVLIDDTLFRRRGKKVWAASWFHDRSAQGPAETGYGNNWVVLAVRVRLPMVSRPVEPWLNSTPAACERAKHAAQILQEEPRGHHRTRWPRAKTVCHDGRHRRRDARAQQPPRKRRNRRLPPRRVEHHHRTGLDQTVHRQRHQPAGPPRLAVRPHRGTGVLVGCNRSDSSDAEHRPAVIHRMNPSAAVTRPFNEELGHEPFDSCNRLLVVLPSPPAARGTSATGAGTRSLPRGLPTLGGSGCRLPTPSPR
jgi:hypothetical protein